MEKVKYKIGRYINNITLNGLEWVLDDNNKIILFDSIDEAKGFLRSHGIDNFEGIEFEEI